MTRMTGAERHIGAYRAGTGRDGKGVNMGIRQANKLLQRAVGVEPDGMIGPKTLAAIKSENPNNLVSRCRDEAKRFYKSLVAQDQSLERFLKGWIARA